MTDPCRFVVWPHHPDLLRRPATNGKDACVTQALTWNIFRAAELLPPAFWLRRLNTLFGLAPPCPAPVTARVQLWVQLPVPPGHGFASSAAVAADIVIETERAVWAMLVCNGDVASPPVDTGIDRVAMMAYAASWYAGRRPCYVGLIVDAPERAPLGVSLIRKYQLSSSSLHLRWPDRHHDGANLLGLGFTTWRQLIAVLCDAAQSDTLAVMDRNIARHALDWSDGVTCVA